jgi:hypothetical protein
VGEGSQPDTDSLAGEQSPMTAAVTISPKRTRIHAPLFATHATGGTPAGKRPELPRISKQ